MPELATPEEVLREVAEEMAGLGFTDAVGIARANQMLCAALNGADALASSQEHCEEYARLWHRDAERVRELEELGRGLAAFTGHHFSCAVMEQFLDEDDDTACTCGLDAVLAALRGPESPA